MKDSVEYTLLDGEDSTGAGKVIFCRDFKHAVFSFATDGGSDAALTVKFAGAISAVSNAAPDFESSQAVDNMWDYINVVDLQDGAAIAGDTGIAVATADDYRLVEANINALEYLAVIVTARTEGEVTVKVRLFNNQ